MSNCKACVQRVSTLAGTNNTRFDLAKTVLMHKERAATCVRAVHSGVRTSRELWAKQSND